MTSQEYHAKTGVLRKPMWTGQGTSTKDKARPSNLLTMWKRRTFSPWMCNKTTQATEKLIVLSVKSHALKGNNILAHSVAQFIPLLTANPALAYHACGQVNGTDVTFLLDTGAAMDLLQSRMFGSTQRLN